MARESQLMHMLDHKHIVKMIESYYNKDTKTINLVLELCERGDLG
jgi:serine/threonine protein kinase